MILPCFFQSFFLFFLLRFDKFLFSSSLDLRSSLSLSSLLLRRKSFSTSIKSRRGTKTPSSVQSSSSASPSSSFSLSYFLLFFLFAFFSCALRQLQTVSLLDRQDEGKNSAFSLCSPRLFSPLFLFFFFFFLLNRPAKTNQGRPVEF